MLLFGSPSSVCHARVIHAEFVEAKTVAVAENKRKLPNASLEVNVAAVVTTKV